MQLVSSTNLKKDSCVFLAFEDKLYQLSQFLLILYKFCILIYLFFSLNQVYAWGDNDHGQQGNGTTTVNRKPTLVQGLEGQKITRVACGSSHSVAWTTVDVTTPSVHEPVLFQTARDSLGASYLGNPTVLLPGW